LKKIILVLLSLVLLLGACESTEVKDSLINNEIYLNFLNSNIEIEEKTELIPIENFAQLQTDKLCYEKINAKEYNKHKMVSGSKAQVFIVDNDLNVVCSYKIDDEQIYYCDEQECMEIKKFVLNNLIENSKTKDRNLILKAESTMKLDWKMNGQDYYDYMNDLSEGSGDMIRLAFEMVFPLEPIYSEYFELGNKKKSDVGYEIEPMNITRIIGIDNEISKYMCLEKNGLEIQCSDEDNDLFKIDDLTDNYGSILKSDILENSDIKVDYYLEDESHCLEVKTDEYETLFDVYEVSHTLTSFIPFIQSMNQLSENMNKFTFTSKSCIKDNLILDSSMEIEIIALDGTDNMVMVFGSDNKVTEIILDTLTDDDFTLPENAISQCQEVCEENTCSENVCNLLTSNSCEYAVIPNCCGNSVCEQGESYGSCSQDCKGLKNALKGKQYKEMFPTGFFQNIYISPWKDHNNVDAIIDENGVLVVYYRTSLNDALAFRMEIFKTTDGDAYIEMAKKNSGNIAKLRTYPGYKEEKLIWRDTNFVLSSKNLIGSCGKESLISGRSFIQLDSDNLQIMFHFYECVQPDDMKTIVSTYLNWLTIDQESWSPSIKQLS